jgi:uncharacterized membrane protein
MQLWTGHGRWDEGTWLRLPLVGVLTFFPVVVSVLVVYIPTIVSAAQIFFSFFFFFLSSLLLLRLHCL